jgi:hypothetical protein
MSDPLKGQRRAVLSGEINVFRWPHKGPCPVSVGNRFPVGHIEVEITRVKESLKAGRLPLWIAEFTRIEPDTVHLLRSAPPAHDDGAEQHDLDDREIRKAAAASAYTSSPYAAVPNEPESVGPDWEDKKRGERELERQQVRKARMTVEQSDAEVDKAAARLKQVGKTLGRRGVDLTDDLRDIYERLAEMERKAA